MRLLLAFLVAAGLGTPAAAQSLAERRSHAVQCLLAMSAASGGAPDATAQDAAKIGILFYAAQLFGMEPGIDLAAAARAEVPRLTRARIQELIPRCGTEMRARQRQLAALGPALRRAK